MHSLLTDPLIRMDKTVGSRVKASLPEVYAALMADKVEAFPALRPHQRHAWHAFLVQLGAMAMHEAGMTDPPTKAETWYNLIRDLTLPQFPDDEPWHLVVDDITKPAFMQPPATASDQNNHFHSVSETPDEIDSPDTAKNHALKSRSVSPAEMDSWLFALITGQTTDAHFLQNPAISRISGKGSRLAFSLTPSIRLGRHARRDITALLTQWNLVGKGHPTTVDGHTLLWTVPWDGKKTLSLSELHPLYIEISRRRRLHLRDGRLYARKAGGNSARIAARDKLKGRTGDPWIPVNINREKALTLPRAVGFTYEQISNCLNTGDWELPLLCRPTEDERVSSEKMYLVARGAAPGEGQNKTGGYYERIIPISQKVKMAMMRQQGKSSKELGRIAEERVDDVKKIQYILQDAIATFIANGADIYNLEPKPLALRRLRRREEIKPYRKQLEAIVNVYFFSGLEDEFQADGSMQKERRNMWLLSGVTDWGEIDENGDGVINQARRVLSSAQDALNCREVQRYKAIARSDSLFYRNMRGRNGFPDLDYTVQGSE